MDPSRLGSSSHEPLSDCTASPRNRTARDSTREGRATNGSESAGEACGRLRCGAVHNGSCEQEALITSKAVARQPVHTSCGFVAARASARSVPLQRSHQSGTAFESQPLVESLRCSVQGVSTTTVARLLSDRTAQHRSHAPPQPIRSVALLHSLIPRAFAPIQSLIARHVVCGGAQCWRSAVDCGSWEIHSTTKIRCGTPSG
jgi:hypothetical protein